MFPFGLHDDFSVHVVTKRVKELKTASDNNQHAI